MSDADCLSIATAGYFMWGSAAFGLAFGVLLGHGAAHLRHLRRKADADRRAALRARYGDDWRFKVIAHRSEGT